MKIEEANKLKIELETERKELYSSILKEMLDKGKYLNDHTWQNINRYLSEPVNELYYFPYDSILSFAKIDYVYEYEEIIEGLSEEETKVYIDEREKEFNENTKTLNEMLERYFKLAHDIAFGIDKLIDMEMEFEGDIIITDPCYIMRKLDYSSEPKWKDYMSYSSIKEYPDYDEEKRKSEMFSKEYEIYDKAIHKWRHEHPNDWHVCEFGENMEVFGFSKYMTRDTLYGDWSCTTYDLDTKEPIGSFCADAGLVSVFLLDEVMKYNPNYKQVKENSWCVTCIRDFKGTVEFRVEHTEGQYEETTKYHNKGDKWENNEVKVYGHGINKVSGKPINFVGTQTGF